MTNQQAAVFRRARAILEVPGVWAQGNEDEAPVQPEHCLITACEVAAEDLDVDPCDWFEVIAPLCGGEDADLGAWNDAPGRTLSEVLALLDRAATRAEAGGGE